MSVIDRPCDRVAARSPHMRHGWTALNTPEERNPSFNPQFYQCEGYVDAEAPERAGREGDTQALPTPNDQIDTQTVAIGMIDSRRQLGIRRYGTALQPGNGRDSLWDATEEALDMFVYLLNHWRELHPGEDIPNA